MDWKVNQKWNSDDDFRAYLVGTLKLPNADAVLGKVLAAPVEFAKGTKRLRYAENAFYLESRPEPVLDDVGTGKHIDVKAIQEHLQRRAINAKISVKLDKNMQTAVSIKEWEIGGKIGFDIKLNPTKLRGPAQVRERLAWIEKEVG